MFKTVIQEVNRLPNVPACPNILREILQHRFLPIMSPLAKSGEGTGYFDNHAV
jgi:hypothetical protein